MARGHRRIVALPILAAVFGWGLAARTQAATYSGNGATGFGGPVGTGSLSVTDDGAGDVTFSLTPGAGHPSIDGNNLVIYLSTGTTGITDTFPLSDVGDSGRRGISGYNTYGPGLDDTRSVIAFPTGFQATYAIAMEGGYAGLFQLPLSGGDGGLTYLTGAAQSGNPISVTFPLATIGLAQGQSFNFVGTLIDGTAAYRSNETIGDTDPNIALGGNPGFNNLITFSSFKTYNSTVVGGPAQWASASGGSWNTAANWSSGVPNAPGAAATLGANLTTSSTITLDGDKTLGALGFDNATASYTIASGTGGKLIIDNTGGAAGSVPGMSIVSGSHTINAPVQLAAGVTIMTAPSSQLTLSGGVSGNGDLSAGGNGTVVLGGTNTYVGNTNVNNTATLNVNGSLPATILTVNGTVNFGANAGTGILARPLSAIDLTATGKATVAAPSAAANRTVLVTNALGFAGSAGGWQGALDLRANDMIVRGGNATDIRTQLKQGLSGTAGIISSTALASTTPHTAIGYASITAAGTFDGQSVGAGDVVLKYTVAGDATLDGSVNFNDLVPLAQNYNLTGTSTWAKGDFNYDGNTNFNDLVALAQNYGSSLSAIEVTALNVAGGKSFAADFALAQSLVPEPGTFVALAVTAMGFASRRRRG